MNRIKPKRLFRRRACYESRLAHLEHLLTPPMEDLPEEEELCEEDWLAHFRVYGKNGFFSKEPEFPQALREYEQAIEEAQRQPDYYPPADFMPDAAEIRRRRYWRSGSMSRPVQESWLWLCSMYLRVIQGTPTLTLKEWDMLTNWYHKHREEVKDWPMTSEGKAITARDLDHALQGMTGKDGDAGKYAAVLRQLFARYHRQRGNHAQATATA